MKTSGPSPHAFSICAAAAVLASCGGSQPIGAPGAMPQEAPFTMHTNRTETPIALDAKGPLLYVDHVLGEGSHSYSVISILSLPEGRVLTKITGYGYISGLCSDASGDVWASDYRHGHWYADKFARAGTKPIEELQPPHRWSMLTGCAVDPASGDLVVLGENIDGVPYALIWSGGREGKPARYQVDFEPLFATYDDAGNLFISGWEGGSDWFFEMAELASGSAKVTHMQLDKHTESPGDVQWDGKYVVVSTALSRRTRNPFGEFWTPRLYRLQVSGSKGHVVQVVQPQGLRGRIDVGMLFVLQNHAVIGMAGKRIYNLRTWPYPAGGKATRSIAHFNDIRGLAISQ
jgi:hypothetical protein